MPKPLKFSERLDRYPPILVRLLAVRGNRRRGSLSWAMTDQQIAGASGLPMSEIKRLSYSTTWNDIPVATMLRFLAACNVALENKRAFKRFEFWRRAGMLSHLHRSPEWESYFVELVEIWADSVK